MQTVVGVPNGLTPTIPAEHYTIDSRAVAISGAAKRLDGMRNAWLNPADLVCTEAEIVPGYPDRILPKNTVAAATLRERTLTNLYNQRPQWLVDAHCDLDAAVAAAYGWAADISEEDALAKLLELNLSRVGTPETRIQKKVKRKSRRPTPEEARQSPIQIVNFRRETDARKYLNDNDAADRTAEDVTKTAGAPAHFRITSNIKWFTYPSLIRSSSEGDSRS